MGDDSKVKPEYPQKLGDKVAIPRVPQLEGSARRSSRRENSTKEAKSRIQQACEPCRVRKTKCSGERPICKHCVSCRLNCYYAEGKRERAKNEMISLQSRVQEYESLLEKASLQVDAETQLAICKAIGKVHPFFLRQDSLLHNGPRLQLSSYFCVQVTDGILKFGENAPDDSHDTTAGEADISNTISGSDSTSSWETNPLAAGVDVETPNDHIDDLDLFLVRDVIDQHAVPKEATAEKLIDRYMNTTQLAYPIVRKSLLMRQYRFVTKYSIIRDSSEILGSFNAIFAIGALYSRGLDTNDNLDEWDHTKYFTRAQILSFGSEVVYEEPDIQQVQVAGLLAIYLMATNQLNRAWKMTNFAIRNAQKLKLYVQTESSIEDEMRARIWYSINSLKRSLAIMTGRHFGDCISAVPTPMEDEVSPETHSRGTSLSPGGISEGADMASLDGLYPTTTPADYLTQTLPSIDMLPAIVYFTEHDRVSKISTDAINLLHCPETMEMNRVRVHETISDLNKRLCSWRENLPRVLDFGQNLEDKSVETQRMALAFDFYHTRMIINKPCLRRIHGRTGDSLAERSFNLSAADVCVESAREIVKLLPPIQNPTSELYMTSPWWCLLHYLVSAGRVLIKAIEIRGTQNPQQANKLLHDSRKLIYWLKVMGKENLSARQIVPVFSKRLSAVSPRPVCYRDDMTANSGGCSPMTVMEAAQIGFLSAEAVTHNLSEENPGSDHSRRGSSISDLELVTYDDGLPAAWGPRQYHPIPSVVPSPGMVFTTPHQMHDIDVEESLSRRGSILSQQAERRRYSSQWNTGMDTALGKRPYDSMPYSPTGGTTNDYSAMAVSDEQHPMPLHVSQLDSGRVRVLVGSIDGTPTAGAVAEGYESKEFASNVVCSTMTFSAGQAQITYQQIGQDPFRRKSQVGLIQMQQNPHHHQHDRSKKRRESPVQ